MKKCIRCKKTIPIEDDIEICEKCRLFLNNNPSKDEYGYWAYALNINKLLTRKSSKKSNLKNVGKWMVFVNIKDLDQTWQKVKIATEKGLLGDQSKCSTAKDNPNAFNKDIKVIIIYTNDFKDMEDVSRVAWQIYLLGIIGKVISYKTDQATIANKYLVHGDKKISLYSLGISAFKDKTEKKFYKYFKEKYHISR
ncbi:MAG: putative phosphothreonine lyase domain-containing protein [Candidatus Woesearchaeota archaeon]